MANLSRQRCSVWVIAFTLWSTSLIGAERTAAQPDAPADWHAAVRDFARQHFKHPAWGYSHSLRDYALARELAAADHVTLDDDVLFAAAYLHDMAAFAPWANDKLDHSDVAADLVDSILKGTGFPMGKIDAVRGAIRTGCYPLPGARGCRNARPNWNSI